MIGAEIVIFLLILAVIVVGAGIALYVLESIGVMKLARNRGMRNPWLIWIPVVGSFTIGALADDIQARQGKQTYFRYLLLGGNLLGSVISNVSNASYFSTLSRMIDNPYYYDMYSNPNFLTSNFLSFGSLIGLAVYVLTVIALNYIYKCYRPQSAASWTVLSAVPLTCFMQSIFPFIIRNDPPQEPNYGAYNPYPGHDNQPPYQP